MDPDDKPEHDDTPVDEDTESDPALNDTSTDWASEGGAVPAGPATDTDNSE